MAINNIELLGLVERGLKDDLSRKETRKLLKELCNKFLKQGLDSFTVKLLLSAHVLFETRYDKILPENKKSRNTYIKEGLAKWRE